VSEKFYALPDAAAEIISEVFGRLEDRAYENSIGIENFDLNGESPEVDSIIGDEDEDEFVDDFNEDTDYESQFNTAAWEVGEQA
jgi:hypothetical protein